jgi:hypothetical protein
MKNRMLTLLLFSACSIFSIQTEAQCDVLSIFKEGTQTTMTHYEANGKVSAFTKTTYKDLQKTAEGVNITANTISYDKKDKMTASSDYTMKCINGVLYFDMKMYTPQGANAPKNMDMSIEGADLEMPTDLEVGKKLNDAHMTFTLSSTEMPIPAMKTELFIRNRKVEAKENITTPAGTFECYRISEDSEIKSIFTVKAKTVMWFSPKYGNIKTESYKENGKLTGKSELTELISK